VDDYIDIVSGICPSTCPPSATVSQYQNVGAATIDGFELEGNYDAGWSYVAFSAAYSNARKNSDDSLLNAATPQTKLAGTLGFRNGERTWDYGFDWRYASGTDSALGVTDPYHLFNAFATWAITPSVSLALNVDNIFNTGYKDPLAGYILDPSYSDIASNGHGRTFRVALTSRIGK
jgi:hemoglobin/transferrin/lactoferrin receptor protein